MCAADSTNLSEPPRQDKPRTAEIDTLDSPDPNLGVVAAARQGRAEPIQ